jgi:uncharacterized protein (TIGR03435 family)
METKMNRLMHKIVLRLRIDAVGVAMPGPRLPQRIRSIIGEHPPMRMSRMRIAALVIFCAMICISFLAVTLARAQSSATDWEKAAGGKMKFDVASIKPDVTPPGPNTVYRNMPLGPEDKFIPTGGLFSARNLPVIQYMIFAYKLTAYQWQSAQSQLPKWATSSRYDIEARASGNPTKDQYRLMMQALLAERFKLAFHYETRELPVLALVLKNPGELGPELRRHPADLQCSATARVLAGPAGLPEAGANGFPAACGGLSRLAPDKPDQVRWGASHVSMATIAGGFSIPGVGIADLNKPIVDRTGLAGFFDFVIQFSPDTTATASAESPSGPTFLEALQDQLGLRLESSTGPVEAIVIDHIEEPTPN